MIPAYNGLGSDEEGRVLGVTSSQTNTKCIVLTEIVESTNTRVGYGKVKEILRLVPTT